MLNNLLQLEKKTLFFPIFISVYFFPLLNALVLIGREMKIGEYNFEGFVYIYIITNFKGFL